MELKSFREKKKKKIGILVFTICCIFLIAFVFFYQSFALFEVQENFNLIEGNVGDIGDISFIYYKDDAIVLEMPSKESGYTLDEKSNCTNGVQIKFNIENWEARLDYSNYTKERIANTTCKLYFREATYSDYVTSCGENGGSASECMQKYENKDTTNLLKDGTVDNNLRYVGANPNNYVRFNNELWRIIGVMNNMKTDEGDVGEARLKIMRNEPIGNISWDTSATNVNKGLGYNDWTKATRMKVMNPGYEDEEIGGSLYWNSQSGQCFYGINKGLIACDYTSSGLSDNYSKSMIADTIWNLGGVDNYEQATTQIFYTKERETLTSENHPSSWLGKIAMIYISDYGYATSGGNIAERDICLKTALSKWNEAASASCRDNNWILNKESTLWTLTPMVEINHRVYDIKKDGKIDGGDAVYGAMPSSPTLYLKTSVKIVNGNGTKENPYGLSLN